MTLHPERDQAWPQWLKRTRAAARLTQAELAKRVGVDYTMVSRWERGARNPRSYHQRAVERVLADELERSQSNTLRDMCREIIELDRQAHLGMWRPPQGWNDLVAKAKREVALALRKRPMTLIELGADGTVLNGHHRLQAMAESQVQ